MDRREVVRERAEHAREIEALHEAVRQRDDEIARLRAAQRERAMVIAEGEMMASVGDETTETRPKGRDLQAGEILRGDDLVSVPDGTGSRKWAPTTLRGHPVLAEDVGLYIRPETPAEPSAPDPGEGWRILGEGETLHSHDEFQHHDGRWEHVGFSGSGCVVERSGRHRRRVQPSSNPSATPQPAPTPAPEGSTPVVDLLVATLRERAAAGLRTYGTPLTAHNGRRADIDALDEACDQAMYLRQLVEEINDVRRVLGASETETLMQAAERVARERVEAVNDLAVALGPDGVASIRDAIAARARITYLEHLAGAQRDAKNLRADLDIEREAHEATRRGWLAAEAFLVKGMEDAAAAVDKAEQEIATTRDEYTVEASAHMDTLAKLAEAEERAKKAGSEARDWARHADILDAAAQAMGLVSVEDVPERLNDLLGAEERAQRAEAEFDAAWTATRAPLRGMVSLAEVITGRAEAAEETRAKLADAEARLQEIRTKRMHRAQRRADLAGLAVREAQAPSGGVRIDSPSDGVSSTWGACEAYDDAAAVDAGCSAWEVRPTGESAPAAYAPSVAPEPVSSSTPDVVEAHLGRYRIRRIDSAA